MATVAIPFREFSSFTTTVTLDRKSFIFEFTWNSRFSFWTYSIYLNDENKTPVLMGKRLILGAPLLDQYHAYKDVPQGFMIVVKIDQGHIEPGRDDFYNFDYALVYEEVEEVAA